MKVHTCLSYRLPFPPGSTEVCRGPRRMAPNLAPTSGLPMAHAFVVTSSNDDNLGVLLGRATKLPVTGVPADGLSEPLRRRTVRVDCARSGDLYVDCRGHGTPQRVGDWRVHLRPLHDLTQCIR